MKEQKNIKKNGTQKGNHCERFWQIFIYAIPIQTSSNILFPD